MAAPLGSVCDRYGPRMYGTLRLNDLVLIPSQSLIDIRRPRRHWLPLLRYDVKEFYAINAIRVPLPHSGILLRWIRDCGILLCMSDLRYLSLSRLLVPLYVADSQPRCHSPHIRHSPSLSHYL